MIADFRLMLTTFVVLGPGLARAGEIEIPTPLDERLQIELFAAEPDIVTVTGLTVDDKGRVLVVESHTHFRPDDYDGPPTDRIRLLEDTTGDGRADRVVTFFEGTTSTMNVAAHPNGWIYIATRDRILRVRDSDDDGRADQSQMLVQLETEADYPHNGLSGFAFDVAGNVYFSFGENMGMDATLIGRAGGVSPLVGASGDSCPPLAGQNASENVTLLESGERRLRALRGAGGIFRCREDGSELERVATGFWNPFHLCFDVFGRMFTGDNDPGNRPPCRFLSVVKGGDYGYKRRTLEPFIAVNAETPGTLPMTSSTGESPTGLIAYESDHLPPDYRGDVLVASWGEHRIDRYHLEREGASFRATTQPVIAGGDHFRPAGIAVAPDGSLYVGDWADRSYPLHKKGRVWHITRRAADVSPRMRTTESGLRSADLRTRQDAARQLLAKGETGIAALKDAALDDADPRVRSIALATLVSGDVVTQDIADRALADQHEGVREQAARTLPESLIDLSAVAREDDSPAVQAAALRRMAAPEAEPLLLERLSDPDPFMRQAAQHGLSQSVDAARLIELTRHPQPMVRLAAVLLLRGGPNGHADGLQDVSSHLTAEVISDVITCALRDTDERVRFVAVEWIGRDELHDFHQPLVDGLAEGATTPELFRAYLAALAQLDGVMDFWEWTNAGDWWVEHSQSERYVSGLLDNSHTSPAVLRQALLFLPADHPALAADRLAMLLASEHEPLRLEAARVLRNLTSSEARSLIRTLAQDESVSSDLRAEAVVGLDPLSEEECSILLNLALSREPAVRREALRTLRGATLDDDQRQLLLQSAPDDEATTELLQRLLEPEAKPARPDVARLDEWLAILDGPADAAAGQRMFFHPRGPGCARCHQIDGRGTAIGPSFVRMGGRLALDRRRLVEAILQPGKDVDPGFLPVTIVTTDGQVATGIFHKQDSNGRLSLHDAEGETRTFHMQDIEQMVPQKTSIMPDGLVNAMTLQEFRDLIAYLNRPLESD